MDVLNELGWGKKEYIRKKQLKFTENNFSQIVVLFLFNWQIKGML